MPFCQLLYVLYNMCIMDLTLSSCVPVLFADNAVSICSSTIWLRLPTGFVMFFSHIFRSDLDSLQRSNTIMTTESMRSYYITKMNGESLNMCPNSQLHTEKWGGHYASFVAMFHSLHSVTNVQETLCVRVCVCALSYTEWWPASSELVVVVVVEMYYLSFALIAQCIVLFFLSNTPVRHTMKAESGCYNDFLLVTQLTHRTELTFCINYMG